MKKAIFAGSFDPIHDGHIKIIEKSLGLFDELFVVVANNEFKEGQSTTESRVKLIEERLKEYNLKVVALEKKYLVDFAKENGIKYLVRSARNDVDFTYELEMAKINKQINNEIETVLIIPDYDDIEFSSTNFRNFKIERES